MWIYIESEPGVYTVGHYDPSGLFLAESDHKDVEVAACRTSYLNGGLAWNSESLDILRHAIMDHLRR